MFLLLLFVIGLAVGAFGTLIGVAGGFLLVPILLFLYPDEAPVYITSMTLMVAFFNALSGTIAYIRLRRVDFRSVLLFSIMSVPGAVLGAILTNYLTRGLFQHIFGALLVLVSLYLIISPRSQRPITWGYKITRQVTDSHNRTFTFSYSGLVGMGIAFFVGVISGLLGIGGGIIHVPVLTQLLSFPVHIATATSHAVVATSTFAALLTNAASGALAPGLSRAAVLSAGAIIGAQFGARLSERVPAVLIIRLLAVGLAFVGARLFFLPI